MKNKLIWDEAKRAVNLAKHGLDFADAGEVLEFPYRLDLATRRNGEDRTQSIAYLFRRLAELSVAHTEHGGQYRVISYRAASSEEREVYYEWLQERYFESDGSR